jgi:hypothetical protein
MPGHNGIVTCPLILSSTCKVCFQQGHFADHCKKRTQTVSVEKKRFNTKTKKEKQPISKNRFDVLADLEDDTDPVIVPTPFKKSFASVLASVPCAPTKSIQATVSITSPIKMAKLPVIPKTNQTRRSWADAVDSDSGEDEDE